MIIVGTRPVIPWTKSFIPAHKIIRVDMIPAELTNQLDIDVE